MVRFFQVSIVEHLVRGGNFRTSPPPPLTHWCLISYAIWCDKDLDQHWLSAWRYQVINWTNVDLSSESYHLSIILLSNEKVKPLHWSRDLVVWWLWSVLAYFLNIYSLEMWSLSNSVYIFYVFSEFPNCWKRCLWIQMRQLMWFQSSWIWWDGLCSILQSYYLTTTLYPSLHVIGKKKQTTCQSTPSGKSKHVLTISSEYYWSCQVTLWSLGKGTYFLQFRDDMNVKGIFTYQ